MQHWMQRHRDDEDNRSNEEMKNKEMQQEKDPMINRALVVIGRTQNELMERIATAEQKRRDLKLERLLLGQYVRIQTPIQVSATCYNVASSLAADNLWLVYYLTIIQPQMVSNLEAIIQSMTQTMKALDTQRHMIMLGHAVLVSSRTQDDPLPGGLKPVLGADDLVYYVGGLRFANTVCL